MPEYSPSETYAALQSASDDAVFLASREGRITQWSDKAHQLFGVAEEDAVQQPLRLLIGDESETAAALREMEEAIARGESGKREFFIVTPQEEARDIQLSWAPLQADALFVARDLTAQRKAERALQGLKDKSHQRAVLLETANRVALDILSSRTGSEALRHIAESARILVNAPYAALGVAGEKGEKLNEFIAVGVTPEEEAAIGTHPCGAGVLGVLLHRPEPLRLDDLSKHPASVGFPDNHPPMTSFLGVPIRRGETVLGSLYLTNRRGGAFTDADESTVRALADHAAVAIHHARLLERQSALLSRLLTAQEEERRAVAHDLHDGLTQYVMAAHAHMQACRKYHERGNAEKLEREFELGLKCVKSAVTEARRLINGLRVLALDDLGLAGALEQLMREEQERAGWQEAEFEHNIAHERFARALETGVYRIVQEALTNVRRHARAQRVRLRLHIEQDNLSTQGEARHATETRHVTEIRRHLVFEVRDWGEGFVLDDSQDQRGHVGLQGVQERVHLLGGTFELQSSPGKGTVLRARFPALSASTSPYTDGIHIQL